MRLVFILITTLIVGNYNGFVFSTSSTSESFLAYFNNGYNEHVSVLEELLNRPNLAISRPLNTGKADNIYVHMTILGIDSIREQNQDFSMTILLEVLWSDWRLNHSQSEALVLIGSDVNKVWIPNMIFTDSTEADISDVTKSNQVVRISKPDNVSYVTRMKIRHFCPMDYVYFPFDVQRCPLKMTNFGYIDDQIHLDWSYNNSIDLSAVSSVAHYHTPQVEEQYAFYEPVSYTENISCIGFTLRLQRQRNFYVWGYMYPAGGLVVLSWINFWIDIGAVPARISLGMTTVLTFYTQMVSAQRLTPKLGYATVMDWWMGLCQTFINLALLEYALAHHIYTTAKKHGEEAKKQFEKKRKNKSKQVKNVSNSKYIPLHFQNVYSDDVSKSEREEEMALQKAEEYSYKRIALAYKIDFFSRIVFPTCYLISLITFIIIVNRFKNP
ncbi:glycine receptor subunit alpha-2-like [Antedon mediterranea]|uniref:glycine receptor subunit alpha-2-like n=1 Tax=Antedon mediterranea TaxID=105859 RepID=UPI003AF88DBF